MNAKEIVEKWYKEKYMKGIDPYVQNNMFRSYKKTSEYGKNIELVKTTLEVVAKERYIKIQEESLVIEIPIIKHKNYMQKKN